MIEEALLTRAHALDTRPIVRTRGRQVFVTTPFDVLACRTSLVDIPQLTATVSSLLDAPSTSTPPNDAALLWPGALPPEKGFELRDMIPVGDALNLAEAIRENIRGLSKVPAQLLDQESLKVSGHGIPNRLLLAAHAMGFLPSPLGVSVTELWARIDCLNGTIYQELFKVEVRRTF
ncbi:hypothetical protein [Corynebacterium glucuronolyticum]|uniref:Uncharacterized protein n=2 Tax=Corynebacterium glucuronolyticum TaxID=39791 RepID=A0A7T4EHC2_9CORY|nr:hypothetical protein [Corynebacterium glucuronolyticum]EEI62354.1 hypothetical protein HMPREF0293_2196 [Corynebacterium glucuronolyticum ATCC 51866]QQB47408.1 hypothetical protein I6I10_05850 [Corynebacterium glucuronolyticum]QRP70045.1 hypothetical protein I6J21_09680 [Corynebacterium glucuronolyticum]WKD64255.1 hypothetical protein CGLUCO_10085 [Corynebacterium glucuronolyticum DSM 44120]SMB78222.1 hypothetical protein SAMN05660745_01871 [Corynebacterium glucuronolyticum]